MKKRDRHVPRATKRRPEKLDVVRIGDIGVVKAIAGADNGSHIVETQEQVAKAFGRTWRTVANWAKEGMPGHSGRYVLQDIQNWLFLRKKNGTKGKNKGGQKGKDWDSHYREMKAKLAELEFKKRQGELILRKDVEAGLIQVSLAIKTALLRLPSVMAPRLQGLEPRDIEAEMRSQIELIVDSISQEKIFAAPKNASDNRKTPHLDA